ncbi:RloB-like protein [Hallella colorans]|uniref:RloB-like protein n=2 Tax=Bacteroidales TaxID=171549 RepID=A0A2U0U054_9BACT|nr:RloB-like protein [Hallella colorans]
MVCLVHYLTFRIKIMARKEAIRRQRHGRAVIIGAGLTERWYFSHLQFHFNLKIKIRPRFFGNENITTLEKRIIQVLSNEGIAVVIFDADVSTWNDAEKARLIALKKKYEKSKRVILCDSQPSIEYWFLLHYLKTNRFFGTSKAVVDELVKYVERFEKTNDFLRNPKWVEDLCNNGKLKDALERAISYGEQGPSYSNVWKAIKYVGIKL